MTEIEGAAEVPESVRSRSTVAVVAALNSRTVAATVDALIGTGRVDEVVVVDDGSSDDTSTRAVDAGASVLRFEHNRGKGAAIAAGVTARPHADRYLFVDADLAATAGEAVALLDPLDDDAADLAIAVFPSAGTKAGFGLIKRWSRRLIGALSGYEAVEPLSGQRAICGDLARSLAFAPRFGLEVAMTIDAARAGARIVEMELPLDHAHSGRSIAGAVHRIRQGRDIARAVVPRIGQPKWRIAAMIAATVVAVASVVAFGGRHPITTTAMGDDGRPVVVFLVAHSEVGDIRSDAYPHIRRLVRSRGATLANRIPVIPIDVPSAAATLGAGAPVVMARPSDVTASEENQGLAGGAAEGRPFEQTPVGIGTDPAAPKVVTALVKADTTRSYGVPGRLGAALRKVGVAYVGAIAGGDGKDAPGALMIADRSGRFDRAYPGKLPARIGTGADTAIAERSSAISAALGDHRVVMVDTGVPTDSIARRPAVALAAAGVTAEEEKGRVEKVRSDGLRIVDNLIGEVVSAHPDARVMVLAVAPTHGWRLGYVGMTGAPGSLTSQSTRRVGETTMGDVTDTIIASVGRSAHVGVGHAMTVRPGDNAGAIIDDVSLRAEYRESVYVPLIVAFIALQAVVYMSALVLLRRKGPPGSLRQRMFQMVWVVAIGSLCFLVGSFLYRLAPRSLQTPVVAAIGMVTLSAVLTWLCLRARYLPLSPLVWVCGLAVVVLSVDAASSGLLQHISLLGYSPVTAARFYGMGNMGYAIFGGCTIVVATALMDSAPSTWEGLVRAGCLFLWVTVVDVAPHAGADFGGAITLVPVFAVLLVAWLPIRWNARKVAWTAALAVGATAAAAGLAVVTGRSTHVASLLSGGTSVSEIVRRKLATNLRVMRVTTWSWMVPIVMAFILGTLGTGGGWRRWFNGHRIWGIGFVALFAFGLLGGALNDSGIVIPALVLVIVGSMIMMIRVRRPFADPTIVTNADSRAVANH